MEFISWDESLNVGIKKFNDDHKELIALINKLNQALKIGGAKASMEQILLSLVNYAKIHFKHEEYYMVLHDYPEFQNHKKEHEELNAQVAAFYDDFKSGRASFSLELMNFLRDWLTKHIKGTDAKYKDFFIGKGVA